MKTKVCKKCKQEKSINDFGVNRFYLKMGAKDGRSIYCKFCNWRTTRHRRAEPPPPTRKIVPVVVIEPPPKPSDCDRVREAVGAGHHTRAAIARYTKLSESQVGDALALLTFDYSSIRIVRVGEEREFHLAA